MALDLSRSVYAYSATNLTHAAPLAVFHSPHARYSTFYIRCAVSPDSRYLATGSSSGDMFMWDTEGYGTPEEAVRVKGHTREVSGLDWGHESVRRAFAPSSLSRPHPASRSSGRTVPHRRTRSLEGLALTLPSPRAQLATCSDDNLVRFWRSDPTLSRVRRAAGTADWQDDHEGWRLRDRWSGEVMDAA